MKRERVTSPARIPPRTCNQHGRTHTFCQLQRTEPRVGGPPEELDRHSFFATRMLIEECQDVSPRFERANELHPCARAHGNPPRRVVRIMNTARLATLPRVSSPLQYCSRSAASTRDRSLERRLSQPAMDGGHRDSEGRELRSREFPVAEVRSDHDGAPSRCGSYGVLQMLEADHFHRVEEVQSMSAGHQEQFGKALSEVLEYFTLEPPDLPGRLFRKCCRKLLLYAAGPRHTKDTPPATECGPEAQAAVDTGRFHEASRYT